RYRSAAELRDALAPIAAGDHVGAAAAAPEASAGAETVPVAEITAVGDAERDLGASPTSFVGRDRELDEVLARFAGGAALVELIGPGGIGKTRLAREVARRMRDRDGCRAIPVALGAARARADVLQASAAALGVALPPEQDPVEALAMALRSRGALLLVIDEAEPVVREVAAVVARWLAAAPQARLLVTSRERLRVPGEVILEIGPLASADGAALFVDRARTARADFTTGAATRELAERIAERLEGSPLAIELAAARVEVLSPAAILARLDDRLKVLSSRRTDRHASLRAVIEWSWSLLDPAERAAMAQLSLFRGGFDAEAAEAVIAPPPGHDAWAVDLVQSLRDKSMLRTVGGDDDVRLAAYETVRLYAEERLAEDAEARRAAILRHAEHFGAHAWAAGERAFAGDQAAERWLLRARDDLLAVADRACGGDGPTLEQAARCLAGLVWALHSRMAAGPALERLARVTARADELPAPLRAHLLAVDAQVRADGTPSAARATALRALEVARATGDPALQVRALQALAIASLWAGEFAAGETAAREAVALAGATGSPVLYERAHHALATAFWRLGRTDEALAEVRTAIASVQRRDAHAALPHMMIVEGIMLVQRGELDAGERVYLEALTLARVHDVQRVIPNLLNNLGVVAHERDDFALARERYEEAIHLLARRGMPLVHGVALGNLAILDHEEGALRSARARIDEAIVELASVGDRRFRAAYIASRGAIAADEDRIDEAERDIEEGLAMARALGEQALITCIEIRRGHIDLALGRPPPDPPPATADIIRMALRLVRASARRRTDSREP
ncbi:MAG TPA: AAA family ATPase, partial [Kofleriaceae bacterium]|nr:AAA family ATPase [Kofleriaceae bacterium]